MLNWLNTHLGTDWATYASLAISILTIWGGAKLKSKYIDRKIVTSTGNVYQSERDNNISTTINLPFIETDPKIAEKIKHDLKIIEEILIKIPYSQTIYLVEQSYLVGMPYKLSRDLEDIEKFSDEKFIMFNDTVNKAKNELVSAVKCFNDSTLGFLTVDRPNKTPLTLDLPYDWKNNGSEDIFRTNQNNMRETSGIMIERYKTFVKTFKENDFITDKL